MAKPVARLGDPTDHGGVILAGSPTVTVDGIPVARVGDAVSCPIHGSQTIVSGSGKHFADEKQIAYVGSSVSCGAKIVAGSPTRSIEP